MAGKSAGRGRLRGSLDNDVYNVISRLMDEQKDLQIDVRSLYQAIQRSNSSLKRKPKKLVEDSLERILEDLGSSESDEEAAAERAHVSKGSGDDRFMNRMITASWTSGTSSPAPRSSTGGNSENTPGAKTSKSTAQDETNLELNGVNGAMSTTERNGEPPKKRRKKVEEKDRSPPADIDIDDLGGIDDVLAQMEALLVLPLLKPKKYADLHLPIPRGVLLHGPPGCGKSVLARGVASLMGLPFVEILGPSIVSGMSGESEKQVRELFDEARRLAPCLIFIDEIDVIAPKRESSQSQMEKRIVAQLLISMDGLNTEKDADGGKPVIVLAATNRPDSLDPALRRAGRFDTEILMGVPNEDMREHILRAQSRHTPLATDVDFGKLAKMTPGFVGADLKDLVGKAGAYTMDKYRQAMSEQASTLNTAMDLDRPRSLVKQRFVNLIQRARDDSIPEPEGYEGMSLNMDAFLTVLPTIVPSSKREGFATIPDVSWSHIGALKSVREELQICMVDQIKDPSRYEAVGITAPSGVLLWGPPGCGKTLLAKAVAAESKANFISVKGPELLQKYVGESERAIRTVFMRARSSVPCVIFFDELDALVPARNDAMSEASARCVNTLLTELDGLSHRAGIYVIAATNRPDIIDEAMLRPGRLETLLFVDLPLPDERVDILHALIHGRSQSKDVFPAGIEEIARGSDCEGFSGADLEALLRKAGQNALKRCAGLQGMRVEMVDFQAAAREVKASVGSMDRYKKLKARFGARGS